MAFPKSEHLSTNKPHYYKEDFVKGGTPKIRRSTFNYMPISMKKEDIF
jgi:hypothetical protein